MIFVEGNDDKKFIVSLLNDLKKNNRIIIDDNINFDNLIEVMGSKSKLLDSNNYKYKRASIKIKNSTKITNVLFIFDADFETDDKNCNGIKHSNICYKKLIKGLNWNIKTEFHIFNRNLDYFLIETIKDKECYKNFDSLVKCLKIEDIKPNKKPIANLYRDLYPYPKFDYSDDKFNELKQKLINLFN
ncbi:MAG: hypothetical protein U9Q30_05800 [Campylobacterota bacterium]|nr:hypothetical protein [Campylobacterota bacterium]